MADSSLIVICCKCKSPLPVSPRNNGLYLACPTCGSQFRIDIFQALNKKKRSTAPQALTESSQATCFYHEEYQAEIACDSCGRFLCGLCDIKFHGGHHCANCIASLKNESSKLVRSETGWAGLVFLILFVSMFLWFMSFLLIPAALFLYFKKGRGPQRVLPPPWYELPGVLLMAVLAASTTVALIVAVFS